MPISKRPATPLPALLSGLSCGFLLAAFVWSPAHAQNMVEAAGATSGYSATTAAAKPPAMPPLPASRGSGSSPHLPVHVGPSPEETNRLALSEHAGADASKLLVRATLPESSIWINGSPVGKVPMLLVVPPGKYELELVGPHAERTLMEVALLPHETRELILKLAPRYPKEVTMRPASPH